MTDADKQAATEHLLRRLGDFGGPRDDISPAYHDMSSDIVALRDDTRPGPTTVFLTVGDVRLARELSGGASARDGYVINREIADLRSEVEDVAKMLLLVARRLERCPECRHKYQHAEPCSLGRMLAAYRWVAP